MKYIVAYYHLFSDKDINISIVDADDRIDAIHRVFPKLRNVSTYTNLISVLYSLEDTVCTVREIR